MSRHTLQIKALLQNKKLSKSRFNPQSSFRIIPQSKINTKNLKRSQSSSSLRKKINFQFIQVQEKYRKLEHNYRIALQQTRQKAILYTKQKSDLEKYKLESQKDKKQIQRLRTMLGFIKKSDVSVQVDIKSESKAIYDKDLSSISGYSKGQQSTDAGMRQQSEGWISKSKNSVNRKQSRVKTPYKLMSNKSQTTIFYRSPLKESNIKSQMSRYKFVPTISLH